MKSWGLLPDFHVHCITSELYNALNLGNRIARITIVIRAGERHNLFHSQFCDCSHYLLCAAYLRDNKTLNWCFIANIAMRNP